MPLDIVWEEAVDEAAEAAAQAVRVATQVAAEAARVAAEEARVAAEDLLDATPLTGPPPELYAAWRDFFPDDSFTAAEHGKTLAYRATAYCLEMLDAIRKIDDAGYIRFAAGVLLFSLVVSWVMLRLFDFLGPSKSGVYENSKKTT